MRRREALIRQTGTGRSPAENHLPGIFVFGRWHSMDGSCMEDNAGVVGEVGW